MPSARSIAALRSRGRHAVQVREDEQVLLDGQRDVEVVELRHDAHLRARLLGVLGQPVAEHLELALVGDHLRRERLHRRRLAGAVRAEQADARPERDVEVEAVDRGDRPEALDDPAQPDRGLLLLVHRRLVTFSHVIVEEHGDTTARRGPTHRSCVTRTGGRRKCEPPDASGPSVRRGAPLGRSWGAHIDPPLPRGARLQRRHRRRSAACARRRVHPSRPGRGLGQHALLAALTLILGVGAISLYPRCGRTARHRLVLLRRARDRQRHAARQAHRPARGSRRRRHRCARRRGGRRARRPGDRGPVDPPRRGSLGHGPSLDRTGCSPRRSGWPPSSSRCFRWASR